jgi:aryl-alcohol dehydrogenase-like predicted oxidoreductase
LGRGFLSGAIRSVDNLGEGDRRHDHPRFQAENLSRNLALLEPLDQLAAAKGCTPAQIALAWLLAQGEDIVPIPGTKRRRYLEENVQAIDVTLDEAEIKRLNQTFVPGVTSGTRYPQSQMKNMAL